jgi:hypothetical protein
MDTTFDRMQAAYDAMEPDDDWDDGTEDQWDDDDE